MKKRPAGSEREDSQANRAKIRKALVAFIKREKRPPSATELAQATGFTLKTVKAHRKRIPLGDGKANVYQQLTGDVVMALYERATGYSHPAVKIMSVSQGPFTAPEVQRHVYTEHYAPDTAAAKLWMQLVEGFSEKTEQKQSGEVKFTFNLIAPAPEPDAGH